jgi:hypothetical protein
MQKHDYVSTFCIDMFAPLLISWNKQVTYSNEITHIYICMKLHVYLCMKLERHKVSIFFWKDTKISKDIEKLKSLVSLLISRDPWRHFETLQFEKYLFFKDFGLELTSNKFGVWNCFFVQPTTISHLT